jgi:hypothetical protein
MDINIGKTDRTMPVDLAKLFAHIAAKDHSFVPMIESDPVATYVVKYGLTQCLNDAHSSITAKSDPDATVRGDKAWNLAAKKLDALYAGELRAERVAKPKDTAGQIAIELAMDVLRGVHGAKVAKLDRAKVAAWCKDYVARNPKVMEEAQQIAARRAELAAGVDESIDLDSLMADAPDSEGTDEGAYAAQ